MIAVLAGLVSVLLVLGLAVGIPLGVYLIRRRLDYSTRFRTFAPGWEAALAGLDPRNARLLPAGGRAVVDFQYEGLPFRLTFADYVDIAVRVPPGLKVTIPADGKTRELAQRIRWDQKTGAPSIRLGCEKSDMLLPTCIALAPVVRTALAASARIDVPAPR